MIPEPKLFARGSVAPADRGRIEPPFTVLSCLAVGEKIIWAAQPRPHVFVQRGFAALMYGATWTTLGLFWYFGAGGVGARSAFEGWWRLFPAFSLPFVIVGLSFFLEPIRLLRRAFRTWYVVSDRRIFIATRRTADAPEVREFTSAELAPPVLKRRFDRLFDLIFTRRAQESPHLTPRLDAGFFGLRDGADALAALAFVRHDQS